MFLLGTDQWVRLERDDFGSDDLALFPGSSHFFVRCPADTIFCVVTLEEERLARTLGLVPSHAGPGAYRLQSRHLKSTVGALRSLVGTFLSMIATSDNEPDDALAQLHLKEALLSTLALAVSTGARTERSLAAPIYGEARALIDADPSAVSVTRFCTALDVSRRTLEDVFRRQLGIGPARFIKTLRLNQIRRELHSASAAVARWPISPPNGASGTRAISRWITPQCSASCRPPRGTVDRREKRRPCVRATRRGFTNRAQHRQPKISRSMPGRQRYVTLGTSVLGSCRPGDLAPPFREGTAAFRMVSAGSVKV